MRISELYWSNITAQIERGHRPEPADIAHAIEFSVEYEGSIPKEALLYIAALLRGGLERGRGRPPQALPERAQLFRDLRQAELVRDVERVRKELEEAGKPHTQRAAIEHYRRTCRLDVQAASLQREYRRAKKRMDAVGAPNGAAWWSHIAEWCDNLDYKPPLPKAGK